MNMKIDVESLIKRIKIAVQPILIMWVLSIFCYLPIISRGLTNSVDGLWASTYFQAGNWELSIGRWAWLFADKVRGGYAAEPFNSLLTLLLITIAVYIALYLTTNCNEESEYNPGISFYVYGMFIMCSTTVCCYLSYRYMSPTFGLSVLLSVVAAGLIIIDSRNSKNRIIYFVIAILCIVTSLGLYQANLGCFCVLVLITMLRLTLENNSDNRKCLKLLSRALLCGIVSCILYKILWDLCLIVRGVVPSSYNGADSLSVINMIFALPRSIPRIFKFWFDYFRFRSGNYVFWPIRETVILFVFSLSIVIGFTKLHRSPKKCIMYFALIALLPLGANVFIILAPNTIGVLTQMTFPMLLVTPLFLSLFGSVRGKMKRGLCILGLVLLYGNIYAVGTDIDAMAQGSASSYSIMNSVVDSLKDDNFLGCDYQYAFYGNIGSNDLFRTNKLYDMASGYAKFGTLQTKPDMVHKAYRGLVDDIGVNLKIVDNALYHEIYYSGILDDMEAFPSDGSIVEKNGVVIVKVSDDYTLEN